MTGFSPARLENGDKITEEYVIAFYRANHTADCLPYRVVEKRTYFFRAPSDFCQKAVRRIRKFLAEKDTTFSELMELPITALSKLPDESWREVPLHGLIQRQDIEYRDRWTARMNTMRLALTGGEPGPPVATTMAILGKDRTMRRLAHIGSVIAGETGEVDPVNGTSTSAAAERISG